MKKKQTKKNKQPTTVKYSKEELKQLKDKTNYAKLDALKDSEIDYSDIPETNEAFWANARIYDPGKKKAISLRVDEDVLNWFKDQDGRYQSLINQVLRQYVNSHRHF